MFCGFFALRCVVGAANKVDLMRYERVMNDEEFYLIEDYVLEFH